jgi:predicted GNAT superfamily acetyltransferase
VAAERFEVRRLVDVAEYRQLERVQQAVWGFVDADTVPLHTLVAVGTHGGLVLGAFDAERPDDRRLVGMAFGFDGRDDRGVKHHSHQLGVEPDVAGVGLGRRLKWAQRGEVLRGGVERITWTFDPLMAMNAWFNVRVLGAVCERYRVDVYGQIRDVLNAGLATDRLVVDWWLSSPRVVRRGRGEVPPPRFDGAGAQELVDVEVDPASGLRVPRGWRAPTAARARLEIPADLQTLKARHPELADAWRQVTREAFLAAFDAGLVVTDVERRDGRVAYLLEARPPSEGTVEGLAS